MPREGCDSEEAIQSNQMDIVRLLVAHGANLNAVDNNGKQEFEFLFEVYFPKHPYGKYVVGKCKAREAGKPLGTHMEGTC